jgi:hypothetical protein
MIDAERPGRLVHTDRNRGEWADAAPVRSPVSDQVAALS